MDSSNFLDFYNILVNELVGDPIIFIVLVLLVVTLILVRSRVPGKVLFIAIFAVTAILAIEFEILRWFLAIGIGYFGWMISRLGRS